MKSLLYPAVPLLLLSLFACEIEPVSTGGWQVEIETPAGNLEEHWTISRDRLITIRRAGVTLTTAVELAGSRVSWALDEATAGYDSPASFSGTVSGNRLAGTLYTRRGNRSVRGVRR